MAASRQVASEGAQRDFELVVAAIRNKYTRFPGYNPDEETKVSIENTLGTVLECLPEDGQPVRADWFLKTWAERFWELALVECASDFGDDHNVPIPGGFGDKSKYQSFPRSLAAAPEHVKKLEEHRRAKEDRERDERLALLEVEHQRKEREAEEAKLASEQARITAERARLAADQARIEVEEAHLQAARVRVMREQQDQQQFGRSGA